MACMVCRRKKLKCDMNKPCSACRRLDANCEYEPAKRRGPKRRSVQDLEKRLALVEAQITSNHEGATTEYLASTDQAMCDASASWSSTLPGELQEDPVITSSLWSINESTLNLPSIEFNNSITDVEYGVFDSWELFDTERREGLPEQGLIDRLTDIYFTAIHPHMPLIHRARFLADMILAPRSRPPLCLRYIMWALAATQCSECSGCADIFYQRARQYMDADEMKDPPVSMTVGHVQCWALIALYETYIVSFARAWMSNRRSIALAQLLCLHQLDSGSARAQFQKVSLRDEIDVEQGRRAFWATFCSDRWASTGAGLPMSINTKDISTHLPCSDEAFHADRSFTSQTLGDAIRNGLVQSASSFAGKVVVACIMGQIMDHCNAARDANAECSSIDSTQLARDHQTLDKLITNTFITLPRHLRFTTARQGPTVAFLNMCLHAATIYLHLAEIDRSVHRGYKAGVLTVNHKRCRNATEGILQIVQLLAHTDPAQMDPYTAFGLYMASTVIVRQHANERAHDEDLEDLKLLMNAMRSLQTHWRMTDSFIKQLSGDLEQYKIGISFPEQDYNTASTNSRRPTTGLMLRGVLQQSRLD